MRGRLAEYCSFKDWSITAWMTGFLAVLISYADPLVIFIQAAQVWEMSPETLSSWIWGISIGAGISGIVLSIMLKAPIITAWSAPGTALLLNLYPHISYPEVIGSYLVAAILTTIIAVSGYFERIVQFIPRSIAAAMLAGILFQFGAQAFNVGTQLPPILFVMLTVFILSRRFLPKFTVVLVTLSGFTLAFFLGHTDFSVLKLSLASPEFTLPSFSFQAFFSFTIPLLIVSLSGQYLPGIIVMRLDGYNQPTRPILTGTALISIVTAFFGGISIVLAAITAAICTGKDSHPDHDKRYVAGIANGVFYLIGGTFAGTIVLLFSAVPPALVAALAGLALIGAIMSNIKLLAESPKHLEPAVITFLATASGMSLAGMGSAFWGIVFGLITNWVLGYGKKPEPSKTA